MWNLYIDLVLWVTTILLVLAFGLLSIPKQIRDLMYSNCFDVHRRFQPKYAARESFVLIDYLGGIFLFGAIPVGIVSLCLVLIHAYVIPLPLLTDALALFSLDGEEWRQQIFHGERGRIVEKHSLWLQKQGIDQEQATAVQTSLWHTFPVAVALSFFLGLLTIRFFQRWHKCGIDLLWKKAHKRREQILLGRV
jgi:hypothetical protein